MIRYLLIAAIIASHALALEDSPANRTAEAERYTHAIPFDTFLSDYSEKSLKTAPAKVRDTMERYQTVIDSIIEKRRAEIREAVIKTLVADFSAEEIKVLADLAESPAGKLALRKHAVFAARLLPAMQATLLDEAIGSLKKR